MQLVSTRPEHLNGGDLLRLHGLRATPQRLAVIEVVQEAQSHICAEEVYRRARSRIPNISLGTVYKALGDLKDLGVFRVLPVAGKLRIDPNTTPHHHLVCDRCKRVTDVEVGSQWDLRLPEDEAQGYEVWDAEVTFRGICPSCKNKTDGTKPQPSSVVSER